MDFFLKNMFCKFSTCYVTYFIRRVKLTYIFLFQPKLFSKAEDNVYLVGTPAVWLINIASLISFALIFIFTSIIDKRESKSNTCVSYLFCDVEFCQTRLLCMWLFIGWATHYLPFFFMNRILFFHHYFPAHVFACMLTSILLDLLFKEVANFLKLFFYTLNTNHINIVIVSLFVAVIVYDFCFIFSL